MRAAGIARTTVRGVTGVVVLAVVMAAAWVAFTDPVERSRSYARLVVACIEAPYPRAEKVLLGIRPLLYKTGVAGSVRVEVEPRISLLLDPIDLVDRYILLTGGWEHELWVWMTPHLPQGGTFVDVGAYIGSHSLRAAKLVGEKGRVVAIEPNPSIAARLRDNIAASRWDNIHVREAACAEKAGRLKLFAGSDVNSGTASLSREHAMAHGARGAWFEVEAAPLDQILEPLGLERIDVIKVDAEGAEVSVLRGAEASIRKYRPLLVVESVESNLRNMNGSLEELEALLAGLGYRKGRYDQYNSEWLPLTSATSK